MPTSKREAIEKRQLEAEKVIMSKMLYEWKRKYGMDYIVIVRNNDDNIFSRFAVAPQHLEEMYSAAAELLQNLLAEVGD